MSYEKETITREQLNYTLKNSDFFDENIDIRTIPGRWVRHVREMIEYDWYCLLCRTAPNVSVYEQMIEIIADIASIASSADGNKLAAATIDGQIYISNDGGETWDAKGPEKRWVAITCSADGKKLAAAVRDGKTYTSNGKIYISNDGGETWLPKL